MKKSNNSQIFAKDIMNKEFELVGQEQTIEELRDVIAKKGFEGILVINRSKQLVGMLSQYELLKGGVDLHIPTVQELFKRLPILKKDKTGFTKKIEELNKIKVKDVMRRGVKTLSKTSSYQDALEIFKANEELRQIPVVNEYGEILATVKRKNLYQSF